MKKVRTKRETTSAVSRADDKSPARGRDYYLVARAVTAEALGTARDDGRDDLAVFQFHLRGAVGEAEGGGAGEADEATAAAGAYAIRFQRHEAGEE